MNKEIIKNILFLFFEKIVTIILVFYSEGMIAKMLSVEEYGQWIYSINFILLLSSLTLIVGSEVSVVALARNKFISGQIICSIFLSRFVLSIISFLIASLYSHFYIHSELTKKFIFILSFFLLFSEAFGVISNYFQANIRIFPIAIIRILGLSIRFGLIFISFHYAQSHASLLALSRVVEVIVVSGLLILLAIRLRKKLNFSFNRRVTKIILYRGLKFWPALIFMYLFQRLDRFFIEYYFSYEFLSQYGIAVQLMEQAFLLMGIVVQSISPKLIYSKLSKVELKNNLLKLLVLIFSISCFLYTIGYLVIPCMIHFIYDDRYMLAIELARIMLVALFFFGLDTVVMQFLYREKMAFYILIKWILLSVISVFSYYILLDLLQIRSMTIVYIINYIAMGVLSIFILAKRFLDER